MHIAIDTNCILPGRVGGIENYTISLIEALQRPASPASRLLLLTRVENHALFSSYGNERTEVIELARPHHAGRPIDNWAELMATDPAAGRLALSAFQRAKRDLLHARGVDLIHFPGNTVNPLDLDLPVVLNLHDLQHRHFPGYFTADEIQNRETWWCASADRADAMIAASDYIRDDLHAQWQVPRAKVFVTPDPFQQNYTAVPSRADLEALRSKFSLLQAFFLYPAAVWPHKNHERLIRTFVHADLANVQLILTGGGFGESSLQGLIESLGATGIVRHFGRVETADLVGLYHIATGMVFPSQHESWSIPIMEAMACGCPVASSNVTSLPEEVGDAGLLFDPEDTDAMVSAFKTLAVDASLRLTLAARGRERVTQFGPEPFLRQLSAAYAHARSAYSARKAA